MPDRGLVVGKFWPPHRGHKFLIDSARTQCNQLTVVLCQHPHERPNGTLRASWLREIHPDVSVLLVDDDDSQDYHVWAANTIRWLGFVPDVLFSSEEYGVPYAAAMHCQHVLIDKARATVPISATMVRGAPLQYWDFLELPVRAWYALRICVVGAESTGKTTLARALAAHYETQCVPEYARQYSERKLASGSLDWSPSEFIHITEMQCQLENTAARTANRILICDTDALTTSIWYRRYFNAPSPEVEAIVANHKRPDLYLVTDPNTPYEPDAIRDSQDLRHWIHETFIQELIRRSHRFQLVTGSPEERLAQAITICRLCLKFGSLQNPDRMEGP